MPRPLSPPPVAVADAMGGGGGAAVVVAVSVAKLEAVSVADTVAVCVDVSAPAATLVLGGDAELHDVCPERGWLVPEGHGRQNVFPGRGWYVSAGQYEKLVGPSTNAPARGELVQEKSPVVLKVPQGHNTGQMAPGLQKYPAGQTGQDVPLL